MNDPVELTDKDKMKLDMWTARDLTFHINKRRGTGAIPRFTSCKKPKYTLKIKRYLMRMEERDSEHAAGDFAVCVDLIGQFRYVWRSDLLVQQEYDEIRKEERSALGLLGKKSKRPVGKS